MHLFCALNHDTANRLGHVHVLLRHSLSMRLSSHRDLAMPEGLSHECNRH